MEKRDPDVIVIGLDFGTTTSKMAWYDSHAHKIEIIKNAEGKEMTPSVAYLQPNGNHQVGLPLERLLHNGTLDDRRIVLHIKRWMLQTDFPTAEPDISMIDVAALLFKKLKDDAKQWFAHSRPGRPTPILEAVVTYPITFPPKDARKIETAAIDAGFQRVEMISEPEAVVWACVKEGYLAEAGDHILVYNFGGGTFDLASVFCSPGYKTIKADTRVPEGEERLGGIDFDQALYEHCDKQAQKPSILGRKISREAGYRDLRFEEECRRCKEDFSDQKTERYDFHYPLDPTPDDPRTTQLFTYTLTRAAFEQVIRDYVNTTIKYTSDYLERAKKRRPITAIIAAGGSAQTTLVQTALSKLAKDAGVKLVLVPHEPLLIAAKGAAYAAHYDPRIARPSNGNGGRRQNGRANEHKRQQYRNMVETAYINDEVLDDDEAPMLRSARKELGLSDEQATRVERSVMGEKLEKIIEHQEDYKKLVRIAHAKGHFDEDDITLLKRKARDFGISEKAAEKLQMLALGAGKDTLSGKASKGPGKA